VATLILPDVPELRVLAIPSGSELTVELYRKSAGTSAAQGLARIATLRLTPQIPGELILAGGTRINISWEDAAAPPR
jgi:hypothetical protein